MPLAYDLVLSALDGLPDPLVLLEVGDGAQVPARIVWANRAAGELAGPGAGEIVGQPLRSALPWLATAGLADALDEVARTGTPLPAPHVVAPPDPQPGVASLTVEGYPVGEHVALTWREATQTDPVDSQGATIEQMYRIMAVEAPELIYRTARDRTITWASPNCATILGWTVTDLLGRRMSELVLPEDLARHADEMAHNYAGDRPAAAQGVATVVRVMTREHGYRWMAARVSTQRDPQGQPDGLLVGMLDVHEAMTASLAAESAQREADRTMMSMDIAAIGMTITSTDGRFLFANKALCHMLGYPREELQGRTFAAITHPDDVATGLAALEDLVAGRTDHFSQRKRYLTRDGHPVWVDVSVVAARDSSGAVEYFVNQVRDVTGEVGNAQALQRSVRQFRMLAENASDIVYQTDTRGVIQWISPSVGTVLGWDPGLLIGTLAWSLVASEDLPEAMRACEESYASRTTARLVCRFRTTSGAYLFMHVTATPSALDGGEPTGAVVALHDVTQERRALSELRAREEQFRTGMHYAPHGMAVVDLNGRILQVNPALCTLLGRGERDLVGHRLAEMIPADARDDLEARTALLSRGDIDGVRLEHRMLTREAEIWVDHAISVMPDAQRRPRLFIHQLVDETAARALRADLAFRADHDVLTGVLNRDNLERALADRLAEVPVGRVAVIYADIDNLKSINDERGHAVGDAAIVAIADRLTRSLRRQDVVARVGGDEFVALIDHCATSEDLDRVAGHLLAACSTPVPVADGTVPVTVSFGAALARPGEAATELMARADRALYRAKREGRQRVAQDWPVD